MWPKFVNSKWFTALLTSIVSIMTTIAVLSFNSTQISKNNIKDQFDKKADKTYVDSQDANITRAMNQHIDESEKQNAAQMELIKSIDGNVKILLNKQR
jgi:hypothetical protein